MNMLLAALEKRWLKDVPEGRFPELSQAVQSRRSGMDLAGRAAVIPPTTTARGRGGLACGREIGLWAKCAPHPRTEQRISEAGEAGFKRIIVSPHLAADGKRPKGSRSPINSIDQPPAPLPGSLKKLRRSKKAANHTAEWICFVRKNGTK